MASLRRVRFSLSFNAEKDADIIALLKSQANLHQFLREILRGRAVVVDLPENEEIAAKLRRLVEMLS